MKTEVLLDERRQVEQELSESEQRYRRLIAATTDYIYTVEVAQGNSGATSHGPGCVAVTGYTSAEFAANPFLWYSVIHEEDRLAVLTRTANILAGEIPPPLEHRLLHKQGGVRWVRNTAIPHRDAQGRLFAYDGLITDITCRKRVELLLAADYAVTRELAETEDPRAAMPKVLELLCQVLLWHHAVYWQCNGGKLRRENGFWRLPLGQEKFESASTGCAVDSGVGLAGRVCAKGEAIWIPDGAGVPELACGWPTARAGLHCGCAFPLRSDHEIHGVIELYSRDVQDADDSMLAALGTMGLHIGQFVERARSKDHLEKERNLLRTLIDNLPDCIFVKDTESRFVLNNRAHLQVLGEVESRAALGKTDMDYFPKELAAQYRQDEELVLQSSQPLLNHEELLVDRTGRHHWMLCTKVPLANSAGQSIGLVGIGRDITARKEADERLARANAELTRRGEILKRIVRRLKASQKKLEETQLHLIQAAKMESVGTLAAGVAHEVKNPLQTILLGIHYLSQKFPGGTEDVVLILHEMRDAVNRASEIIHGLLGLSAANEFQRNPGNLNEVIQRSLRLIHNEIIAAKIKENHDFCTTLPSVQIDASKLEQVFINVFLNSIQAMPDGGTLRVTTRSIRLDGEPSTYGPLFKEFKTQDHLVVAEIEDSGTGIAESDLPRVFDPFFTTKPVGIGTGLGLSVSQKIVDHHGGAIGIKNRPTGGGTQVTVVLKV
jgi:PAS domain S-box-containing protein